MNRVPLAIQQIEASRRYTLRLLNGTPESDWLAQPFPDANHIVWQVGHLLVAEYALTVEALRGKREADAEWFVESLRIAFGRTSVPTSDPADYPAPAELRAAFDNVHRHVLLELESVDEQTLDDPPAWRHPLARTKFQALLLCARHEMVHAGQIGLLRRALGHAPLQ